MAQIRSEGRNMYQIRSEGRNMAQAHDVWRIHHDGWRSNCVCFNCNYTGLCKGDPIVDRSSMFQL